MVSPQGSAGQCYCKLKIITKIGQHCDYEGGTGKLSDKVEMLCTASSTS